MFELDKISDGTITNTIALGKPDRMGRIYSKENFKQVPLFMLTDNDASSGALDLSKICGRIDDMSATHDTLTVNWHTISSPDGIMVSRLLNGEKSFRIAPMGIGKVDANGNVSDYTLHAFSFVTMND